MVTFLKHSGLLTDYQLELWEPYNTKRLIFRSSKGRYFYTNASFLTTIANVGKNLILQ